MFVAIVAAAALVGSGPDQRRCRWALARGYPFVRLHQASDFYGVASTLLGTVACSKVDLSLACMSVVNLANDVTASCNRESAQQRRSIPVNRHNRNRSGPPGAPRRSARAERCIGRNLLRWGPRHESEPDAQTGCHEPQDLDPKWYTVSQVASLLGYGETKVRMLIICGDLRSLKSHSP